MGTVSQKYKVRAARIRPACGRMRGDIGKLLIQGGRDALQAELYSRTPLPVTKKMLRSIQVRYLGAFDVAVGFDKNIAPHADIRLKKRGKSKTGGHDMTMDPAKYIERHTLSGIRQRSKGALGEILKS